MFYQIVAPSFMKFLEGIKVNGESPKDHQIASVASKVKLKFIFDIVASTFYRRSSRRVPLKTGLHDLR